MKVIILAGGRGTRLSESAKNTPKPLIEVGSKPILQHQIDWLEKHGLDDIRLSLGHRSEQIIDYLKGKYEYVVEPEPLKTGGAIKFASKDLDEDFLVINGDILTDLNLSEMIDKFKNSSLPNFLAAYEVKNPESFGLIKIEADKVVGFLEKPTTDSLDNNASHYINAGFYIFSPTVFKKFPQKSFLVEKEIFPQLASSNKLGVFTYKGFWTDVGVEERLKEAREIYKNNT